MNRNQTVQRIIDLKNSQSYVQFTDGRYGFLMTSMLPYDMLVRYTYARSVELEEYNKLKRGAA